MLELFPSPNWSSLLVIPGMLIGYTVHELGHALTAYFLGDHTQVEQEKITLNPLEHISWLGAFAFIIFGIGWPKIMQVNPHNFKRKHLDMFLVAIAGPIASLTMTLIGLLVTVIVAAGLVYGSGTTTNQVAHFFLPTISNSPQPTDTVQSLSIAFTGYIATTSFWLTFMSMLPFPGQDGFVAALSLVALFRQGKKTENRAVVNQRPTPRPSGWIMSQHERRNNAADIHFKIGAEYHEENKFDDAIARYRQAISNDQNFGPAYINMGLAYLAKHERKKAIQAFRGAIQHADEENVKTEAWHQLHLLSEISPIDEDKARISMAELGATPWTDTKPQPNWWGLGIGSGLLIVVSIVLYAYLLSQLIELLKA